MSKAKNRIIGARNRKRGKSGEKIAHEALERLGYKCVCPIATPCVFNSGQRKMVPVAKVTGDFHAVGPEGVAVLAEVKTTDSDKLRYSFLGEHQREDLDRHDMAGGIALLIWVHENVPHVLEWPVIGFKSRTSLKIEDAKRLNILAEGI